MGSKLIFGASTPCGGDQVISSEKADIKPGNVCLKSMPVGTIVHNVEMKSTDQGTYSTVDEMALPQS
jgi:ribosomal protein L2